MSKTVDVSSVVGQPGVKPARQGRSIKRRDDLIHAGMKLLMKKTISEISIIELTASCGYSVGTFYSRFEDKDSFFLAVQEAAVAQHLEIFKKDFEAPYWKTAPAEEVFRKAVDNMVDAQLTNFRGVVKESFISTGKDQNRWAPIRECGASMSKILVELLEPKFLKSDPKKSLNSVTFAMQMFFGTLVQAVVHDPGPVKLDDPDFRENLTRMMIEFAILEPDT